MTSTLRRGLSKDCQRQTCGTGNKVGMFGDDRLLKVSEAQHSMVTGNG